MYTELYSDVVKYFVIDYTLTISCGAVLKPLCHSRFHPLQSEHVSTTHFSFSLKCVGISMIQGKSLIVTEKDKLILIPSLLHLSTTCMGKLRGHRYDVSSIIMVATLKFKLFTQKNMIIHFPSNYFRTI